jgi:hypothetical protein
VTVIADRHQERFLNALHLDDSGSLGVLSTPIKTRWKGLLVRRKLYICRQLGVRWQYQPVALLKIKFDRPK